MRLFLFLEHARPAFLIGKLLRLAISKPVGLSGALGGSRYD